MQASPSAELLPFIKHYLFLDSEGNPTKKLRLFSDGNTGIVFCMRGYLISSDKSTYLPHSFLYGQISDFKDLYLTYQASLIIVVFQPDGINKLLGISANELRDKIISVNDFFGWQGSLLYDHLMNLHKTEHRLKALNKFFQELAYNHIPPNQVLIQASLNFITTHKGIVTIQQLIKHTGYTERHIERAFKESIGISPKKFVGIVKLHSFLKLLRTKSAENNITKICYDSGYFDQSHLIKEFRKYTGITPTDYLNQPNKLAINFMEVNSTTNSMSGFYNSSR